MKIAIPVWEGKVSPVLDTSNWLQIIEVKDDDESLRYLIQLNEHDLMRRSLRIKELHIDTLICGAISRSFLEMLTTSGINVIQEISGHAEDVLKAYFHGNLFCRKFMMPGSKRKPNSQCMQRHKSKVSGHKREDT